jgi:peptidoglycan/LPS O-acetylase OafA/YrhL
MLKPEIAMEERIIIASIYMAYILFLFDKLQFLQKRPLIYLGKISFAWYLIHQHVGYVIINALKPYVQNHWILVPPILITLALAHFVTFYVEIPSMKYLKNSLLKRKPITSTL